jgi:hypothetical protein
MIDHALRGKSRGAKKPLFEKAIVALLGPKYPKLADRWQVLLEEGKV